jgi:uncharacterized protein (DUF983 family)
MKREGPLGVTWRWLYTLLWLGARKRCPKCGQGQMFRSYIQIHTHCPACEVKLQPYAGDSLGVYAVCYFVTILITAVGMGLAYLLLPGLSPYGYLGLFAVLSGGVLFGLYPNMKGLWVAFVYLLTGLRKQL